MTIKELRKTILHHNHCYYDLDAPEIADYEYDQLIAELRLVDPDAEDFIEKNLGQAVFGEKWNHAVQMGSLLKCHTADEVNSKIKYPLVATDKIDGASLALHYAHGHLIRGVTRGDGREGEVVTANVKQMNGVLLFVEGFKDFDMIEVRGEAYVNKDFFYTNRDRIAQEEGRADTFANPRNYASGSLRQKDSSVTKRRNISFVAYKIIDEERILDYYHETLDVLEACGFEIPKYFVCVNGEDVENSIEYFRINRPNVHYDTDGVVFMTDNYDDFENMGYVGKTPKGALAFKFDTEKQETVILDVEWSVGRTGKVTPVALLQSTVIAGSTVSRMTLNNCDFIEKNDVAIGDEILFEKANEIIPQLVEVLVRPANRSMNYPAHCPSCNTQLKRDSAYLVCGNSSCPDQIVSRIEHFLKQLGVKGISDKTLIKIFESGLATTLREMFLLDKADLMQIGFGERQSEIFVDAIKNIKVPPEKFLGSLGIDGASERSFSEILKNFNFDDVVSGNISVKDFSSLSGFGETSAETIVKSLKDNRIFIESALEFIEVEQRMQSGSALSGLTFCITGTLSRKRSDVEEMIRDNGGSLKGVGRGLNYLVCGDDAGSKIDKAQKLGIPVISEDNLYMMIS